MNQFKKVLLAFLILGSFSFSTFHHGWANYDQDKVLDYTGVIQEFTFENPHATAKIKHKNKTWLTILAPTSRMEARNVPIDKLQKGNSIRVVGYPHKKIKNEMRVERIFVGNDKYELR